MLSRFKNKIVVILKSFRQIGVTPSAGLGIKMKPRHTPNMSGFFCSFPLWAFRDGLASACQARAKVINSLECDKLNLFMYPAFS